ncbi:hypothetical protein A0U40_14840 [[Bacillus] sp. KCTC 13219]|nr:hypothetical protein A0U40_14840 [[Bacillus] sp. KCTC 13219]
MTAKNIEYINFEEERLAFNKYQGTAEISIDFSDNTVIADIHTLRDYESETIVSVVTKGNLHGRDYTISRDRLYKLLEAMRAKYEDGWTREDFEIYGVYEFAEYFAPVI